MPRFTFAMPGGVIHRTLKSRLIDHAMALGPQAEFTSQQLLDAMLAAGDPTPARGTQQIRASMQPYIELGLIETVERGTFRLAPGAFDGSPIPSLRMRQEADRAARKGTAMPVMRAVSEDLLRALFRCMLTAGPASAAYAEAAPMLGQLDAETLQRWETEWQAHQPRPEGVPA